MLFAFNNTIPKRKFIFFHKSDSKRLKILLFLQFPNQQILRLTTFTTSPIFKSEVKLPAIPAQITNS